MVDIASVDAANRAALAHTIADARADGRDEEVRALRAVHDAADGDDTWLLSFNLGNGDGIRAAICSGNLQQATHVAILVPGLGTSTANLAHMADEMRALRTLADAQNQAHGNTETTAAIAWLGYRTPTLPESLQRDHSAASYRSAVEGGKLLTDFTRTFGAGKDVTIIGHSYGSVVAGAAIAAADPTPLCQRFVAAGSPGLGFTDLAATNRAGTDLYILEAFGDAVAGLGWFGADPDTLPGARRLSTRASIHGTAGRGHTHYLETGTTSMWNIAAVAGGRVDLAVDNARDRLLTRTGKLAATPIKLTIRAAASRYHEPRQPAPSEAL